MKILSNLILAGMLGLMGFALTGCAPNLSANNYSYQAAGQPSSVLQGTIVSRRTVEVSDDQNAVGTLAGGTLGAVAGSQIGGSTAANIAGGVGGAVLGGIIGNMAQKQLTKQTAMEYIIRVSKNKLISVVQGTDTVFAVGQRVMVQYNNDRARIIADPAYVR